MRSTKRVVAAGISVTALLLATAACGSDDDKTADEGGGSTATALKLGYVLPESGSLAFLGPPQVSGMNYAIKLINDAGGVLGKNIEAPVGGDEADDAAVAAQSADRVLSEDVDAIIGAAASGMSLAIIDKITGAGVAQCSGSNTAPTFTDYDDNGLYFRTAPSDALQGPILADVVTGDGHSNIAIVARADDYGKGLANATATALENSGATVALNETYDPKATQFDGIVQKVVSAKPDAVVVVAFEEGKQILKGLLEAGMSPKGGVGFYGADGLRSEELATLVDAKNPGVLSGMKGTAPASADNPAFIEALKGFDPQLKETQFAPQVFDCVNIVALAAEAAKSTDANDFKSEVVNVTRDGEKCTTFADCKKLLDDGQDIDYDGASGPLDFVDAGEPGVATIEVYSYDDAGKLVSLETREAKPVS